MIRLQLSTLRKARGLTQQNLADALNVSFQTISKWENGITFPDITMLPLLSDYFGVTTDALLGLKPLHEIYRPADSGTRDYWSQRADYLSRTRNEFWNMDYLHFLVDKVWCLRKPVNMLDCGCSQGYMGQLILPLLPKGSTYTGIDFSGELLENARKLFKDRGITARFIEEDLFTCTACANYDLVFGQALLRHVDRGMELLKKMIGFAAKGGLIVSIETHREYEADALYVDGMDYSQLCRHDALAKLWQTELALQGRDYAIAMKIPHAMHALGLKNIDVRMNDRISFVAPDSPEHDRRISDILLRDHWTSEKSQEEIEPIISWFMNRGADRKDAEDYCRQQNAIASFVKEHGSKTSLSKFGGMMISYGWK